MFVTLYPMLVNKAIFDATKMAVVFQRNKTIITINKVGDTTAAVTILQHQKSWQEVPSFANDIRPIIPIFFSL